MKYKYVISYIFLLQLIVRNTQSSALNPSWNYIPFIAIVPYQNVALSYKLNSRKS